MTYDDHDGERLRDSRWQMSRHVTERPWNIDKLASERGDLRAVHRSWWNWSEVTSDS